MTMEMVEHAMAMWRDGYTVGQIKETLPLLSDATIFGATSVYHHNPAITAKQIWEATRSMADDVKGRAIREAILSRL